jgi:hypothetical protein
VSKAGPAEPFCGATDNGELSVSMGWAAAFMVSAGVANHNRPLFVEIWFVKIRCVQTTENCS